MQLKGFNNKQGIKRELLEFLYFRTELTDASKSALYACAISFCIAFWHLGTNSVIFL